uniref:Maternal embryonic leucine zipper kinase n=1 Tax=Hucho hucho TaxID=62062 RepID=A0A4W5LPG7_9TELE
MTALCVSVCLCVCVSVCLCVCVQWRYDQTTATYLLLLSKKQRGKPVRIRPQLPVCDVISCSPLHLGVQALLFGDDDAEDCCYDDDLPCVPLTPQQERATCPSADKRRDQTNHAPTPEREPITHNHRRQERRDRGRERTNENKENVAMANKDADIFALPAPRSPVANRKATRPNKRVLTTPTHNNTNHIGNKVNTPQGGGSTCKDPSRKRPRERVERKEEEELEMLAFSPERRSRSLDLAGASRGDSSHKRKGGKVFGSLERGLDKVITMLTPSKRRGLRDGPRRIKVHIYRHPLTGSRYIYIYIYRHPLQDQGTYI